MRACVTIGKVPDEVGAELAARAARAGRSLREHLRRELIELAARPSRDELWDEIREAAAGSRLSAEEILAARDADRR